MNSIKRYLQEVVDQHLPEFGRLSSSRGVHSAMRVRTDGLYEGIEFVTKGRPDFEFKFQFLVSYLEDFLPGVFCICSDPAHLKVTTDWIASRDDVYEFRPEPDLIRSSLEPLIGDLPLVRPFLERAASQLLSDPLLSLAATFLNAELPPDREAARLLIRDRLIDRGAEMKLPVSQTREIKGMALTIVERRFGKESAIRKSTPKKRGGFSKDVMPSLGAGMRALGFEHATSTYFTRTRGKLRDVLFLDLMAASRDSFCAVIGINLPFLDERTEPAFGMSSAPALYVSTYLGHIRSGGGQRWYRFGKSIPLPQAVQTMLDDFRVEGLPWLESFQSLSDVARIYYDRSIGSLRGEEERWPDPMSWAFYGWMLQEAGDETGAATWLDRARAEFRRPLYMKKNRFLREPEEGARQVDRPPEDIALARLLG